MELNNNNMKKILFIIIVTIFVFLGVQNFNIVLTLIGWCIGLFTPFIMGLFLAFTLNVLLKLIEDKIATPLNRKNNLIWRKYQRGVCILLTYGIVGFVLFILFFMIVPQIGNSLEILKANIPKYADSFSKWMNGILMSLDIPPEFTKNLVVDWDRIGTNLWDFTKNIFPNFFNTTVGITSSIFSGVFNTALSLVFSIYMLSQKEKLCFQIKKVIYAFIPIEKAEYLVSVGNLSNKIFSKFVSGQITEAVILGSLCFMGMKIFRMPYELLISTIIGCTALVPIFGAFIGIGLGAFLLLMINPIKAVSFVCFVLVLQQLEGNIIYPRVVGSSIGLPGIWVLFTVMVSGGIFGIVGMLIGIPLASVFYSLFKTSVNNRLKKRDLLKIDFMQDDNK